MSPISELYNSLPCLAVADRSFVDRDSVFAKLAPVLAKYGLQYGVTLVHAHCAISDDEIMLDDGNNITLPQPAVDGVYADRWLSNGKGFEFKREYIPEPPVELLSEFRALVGELPLGLCWVGRDMAVVLLTPSFRGKRLRLLKDTIGVERTEGRRNIVTHTTPDDPILSSGRTKETVWIPGAGKPVKFACYAVCHYDSYRDAHFADHA